ncbi:uncharacterized protein (DUF2252 family) [Agromyces terreus]|uniref:Uncharacterized protein (DUF2252 family) n=1 Tax=Agromyces terreus TaxID=424795 RepID=A0A9X2H7U0_9MICO|nr:DUF2252 domain-containing protein [Agromyces terreus]MCP2371039.1 uncharacterized protein (DUF2252 family) [Agromyces terreus]
MSPSTMPVARLSPQSSDFEARRAAGLEARARLRRSGHAEWTPPQTRVDPVALLEGQAAQRDPDLVPIRHGRMRTSPFAFFRGAALIMAADLATIRDSGLVVQLCGDAHLSNFGLFGSAERRLVFDMNDFDETLPGPFEWDVKRLVASIEIAGRHRGFTDGERDGMRRAAVRGYREQMQGAAGASVLDAWYDTVSVESVREWVRRERKADRAGKRQVRGIDSVAAKARSKDRVKAVSKLVGFVDGRMRILPDPPLVVPVEDFVGGEQAATAELMREVLDAYRSTLGAARHPLSEYSYVHMARRVSGVGSVGTRSWIVLLRGRDDDDAILLQAKEAQASVLERFLGPSEHASHGERVVRGQRLMQASGDIFLGWSPGVTDANGRRRDFYLRQLHDWKGSFDPEKLVPHGAELYARLCGETLARAHGRTGDRVAIAAYLGGSRAFDDAVSAFAVSYADQNDEDFRAFTRAIDEGRIAAVDA